MASLNWEDTVPFAAGLVSQILGAFVQDVLLKRLEKDEPAAEDYVPRLTRDGDVVQLVAALVAVVPAAVIVLRDRPALFFITIVVSLAFALGLLVWLLTVIPRRYYTRHWFFMTKAGLIGSALCVVGAVAALLIPADGSEAPTKSVECRVEAVQSVAGTPAASPTLIVRTCSPAG